LRGVNSHAACVYDFRDIFQALGFVYDANQQKRDRRTTMQTQRKRVKPRDIQVSRAPRPEYVAAIRYPDGRRDLFHIRNADNLADARELVISEVGDVQSVVIALRH